MTIKRKLIKVDTFEQILAEGYIIDGTKLYVMEFLTFGFAYSSYYILLRSKAVLSKLDDEAIKSELLQYPYRFGKRLDFGKNLWRERGNVYYTDKVKDKDIKTNKVYS